MLLCNKKTMCLLLGIGLGAGATYLYTTSNSADQKVRCLKRKLKKVEKQMKDFLNNLKPDQMQKYKKELETKYEEIKTKIDSLTVKDMKNKASDALDMIKEHIKLLSSKITSLTNSNSSENSDS